MHKTHFSNGGLIACELLKRFFLFLFIYNDIAPPVTRDSLCNLLSYYVKEKCYIHNIFTKILQKILGDKLLLFYK